MAIIVGVRFQNAGKLYYFDPLETGAAAGDSVIVETARGQEIGEAVTGPTDVPDEDIVPPLRPVLRVATQEDLDHEEENKRKEKSAFDVCKQKISEHQLPMKLVSCEYTFDNTKLLFYFTAESRVDFRALVKDLASVFHVRIELRQIGVRDEARMMGGLGICGRPLCCSRFLGDFHPVSIKMAKEQNLSLNPTKISGACGRLMCCLQYEEDFYEKTSRAMPRVGKPVHTPDGDGIVAEVNILKETVRVRINKGNDMTELKDYPADQVQRLNGQQPQPAPKQSAPEDEPDPEVMRALHAAEMDVPDDDADQQLPPDDSVDETPAEQPAASRRRPNQRSREPRPENQEGGRKNEGQRPEGARKPGDPPRGRNPRGHASRGPAPAQQTPAPKAEQSAPKPQPAAKAASAAPVAPAAPAAPVAPVAPAPKRDPWVVPEEYRQKKSDNT